MPRAINEMSTSPKVLTVAIVTAVEMTFALIILQLLSDDASHTALAGTRCSAGEGASVWLMPDADPVAV